MKLFASLLVFSALAVGSQALFTSGGNVIGNLVQAKLGLLTGGGSGGGGGGGFGGGIGDLIQTKLSLLGHGGGNYDGAHYDGGHYDGGHYDGGHYDGGHYDGGHYESGHYDGGHQGGGHYGGADHKTILVKVSHDHGYGQDHGYAHDHGYGQDNAYNYGGSQSGSYGNYHGSSHSVAPPAKVIKVIHSYGGGDYSGAGYSAGYDYAPSNSGNSYDASW